jgi:hypothetical protein
MSQSNPLPTTIIRVPKPESLYGGVNPFACDLVTSDGKPFPLAVTKAIVTLDWNSHEPVTLDIKAMGGFEAEVAAGLRYIEINGRKFRLVEVLELP